MATIDPSLTDDQKAEIRAMRAAAGLDGEADRDKVANLLSAPTKIPGGVRRVKVSPGTIQRKVLAMGKQSVLNALKQNPDPAIAVLAETTKDVFDSPQLEPLDIDDPSFQFMLTKLKEAGVVNDSEIGQILALADQPYPESDGPSPFESAFGDFRYTVDGVAYQGRCHAALVEASEL